MAASCAPRRTLSSRVAVPSLLTLRVDLISSQEVRVRVTAARRRGRIFFMRAEAYAAPGAANNNNHVPIACSR